MRKVGRGGGDGLPLACPSSTCANTSWDNSLNDCARGAPCPFVQLPSPDDRLWSAVWCSSTSDEPFFTEFCRQLVMKVAAAIEGEVDGKSGEDWGLRRTERGKRECRRLVGEAQLLLTREGTSVSPTTTTTFFGPSFLKRGLSTTSFLPSSVFVRRADVCALSFCCFAVFRFGPFFPLHPDCIRPID